MSLPDQFSAKNRPADDWMEARVEPYVDGELPSAERARFERVLSERPRWRQALRTAREVQAALRTMPRPACPEHVVQAALTHVQQRQRSAPERPPVARRRIRFRWQPVAAMTTLLALVLCAALLGRPAPPEPTYTRAEIERATEQARWTLAYLAHVSERTGETVQQTVREAVLLRDASPEPPSTR